MKYKRIDAALHNVGHAFVSLTNYVHDVYVVDVLPEVLRALPEKRLTVCLPEGRLEPDVVTDDVTAAPVLASVRHLAATFGDRMRSERVDPDVLRDVRMVLWLENGLRCALHATDDRGRSHDVQAC